MWAVKILNDDIYIRYVVNTGAMRSDYLRLTRGGLICQHCLDTLLFVNVDVCQQSHSQFRMQLQV